MRTSIFSFMLLLVHVFASAQQSCDLIIAGQVLDKNELLPLEFTEVVIAELNIGTIADSNGHYQFTGICPGRYTLTATHIGCVPVVKVIELRKSNFELNFYPEHYAAVLSEAVVVEEGTDITDGVRVNDMDLEQAKGKSIAEAVESISGTNLLQTGNAIVKPVIHGLYGIRVVTLNNGVRQEDQQWGLEHGLNIDPFIAGDITVVKGAASVQYGTGAIGGVVKVEPAALPFNRDWTGSAYLIGQSNGKGGSTSIDLGKGLGDNLAFRVQASGKKLGDHHAPEYNLSNTASEELNASLNIGYKTQKAHIELFYSHYSTEIGILAASHIGNLTDLQNSIESGKPYVVNEFDYHIKNPRQEISHDLLKFQFTYKLGSRNTLSADYAIQLNQRREFDIRRDGRSGIPANFLKLKTHTSKFKFERQRGDNWKSTYGLSTIIQENTNVPGTGFRPILPNFNKYQAGIFGLEKFNHGRWKYELGLRTDIEHTLVQKYTYSGELIKPQFDYLSLGAVGGFSYQFSEKTLFRSTMGVTYRAPHVNELLSEGLHHGSASIEEGDISLLPEKSLNWNNSLRLNYDNGLEAEVMLYANPFLDYIYLEPQPELRLSIRGAFPVYQYKQTNALLTGVDINLRWKFSPKWSYEFKGAYMRGIDLKKRKDLVLIPPENYGHGFKYTFGNWKKINSPYLKITHQFFGFQNHYPDYHSELAALFRPPSAYHLLGLESGLEFKLEKNRSLTFSLYLDNVLNTSFRNYMNRLRYYSDEAGRNLIVHIRYKF